MTPSGTPALTKPMNSGTAEQEQNGVTVPSIAASTLPMPSRFPARRTRVFSGEKKLRTTPMPNTTSASSISTFGVSYAKKLTASPSWLAGSTGSNPPIQVENGTSWL